jgi:hypothetical protein
MLDTHSPIDKSVDDDDFEHSPRPYTKTHSSVNKNLAEALQKCQTQIEAYQ